MIALLLLALAAAAVRWGGEGRAALLVALALAAVAGTTLPDLDQALPLGGHRSAFSHSLLPAVPWLRRRWRPIAAGLAFGLALHLSADLFPREMRGFATIKLLGASLGGAGSRWWLGLNLLCGFAAAAAYTAATIARPAARRAMAALAAFAACLYLSAVDGGWWAMAVLAAAGGAGWHLARRRA